MWVIFPIISSFFYGIADFVDNHLVDNVVPKRKAAAFSFLRLTGYALSMVILLAIFGRAIFMFPMRSVLGVMAAGAINVIGQMYLFRALQEGETVDIKIFSQTGPLISLGLGAMVLGEKIASNQAAGLVMIILGTAIVALFNEDKKHTPDFKVAGITLIYTFFSILSDIVLVYFLSRSGTANYVLFGQSFFFFQLGCLIFTSFIMICMPSWRTAIARNFLKGKDRVLNLSLSLVDNLCFGIADASYKLALVSIPVVAMLTAVTKASSLFVALFITFVFSKIFPKLIRVKKMSKNQVARYILSAILIVSGIFVMV